MTAEGAASSVLGSCEHRTKKSLFKAKEVRKKLKSNKSVKSCEECERNLRTGQPAVSTDGGVYICVSCGCVTCNIHAKKHSEAPRTGDKHCLILNISTCDMRCIACDLQLTPLDEPHDLIKLFCNEYRSFVKSKAESRSAKIVDGRSSRNGFITDQDFKTESTQLEEESTQDECNDARLQKTPRKRCTNDVSPDRIIPAKGLTNLGNTCFFNSVMQCMMHTHHLTYYFHRFGKVNSLNFRDPQTVVVNEEKVELEPVTIAVPSVATPLNAVLRGFIAEFYCGATPSPGPVFSQISCKTPRFKGYQQQDAHELLRYLLDGLRSEELERYKCGIASHFGVPLKANRKNIDSELVMLAKGYLQAAGRPLLDMVFGGTLLQTILCSECGHVSERHEQFLDLSIPVTLNGTGRHRGGRSAIRLEEDYKVRKKGRKGKRKVPAPNDNVNEDDVLDNSETCSVCEDDRQYTDDEIDRLAAGVNRLDFTKGLVCPPEEYSDGVCSIGSCLLEFTDAEQLQGINAYECESCCVPPNKKVKAVGSHKKRVRALKRYLVYEPPAVLTLHLKRFQQIEGSFGRTSTKKLSGHVSFPVTFDLAPFCCKNVERLAPGEKRLLYSLYGVVVHSGGLSGGHYIAYVKSRQRLKQARAFLESARKTCADALSCQNGTIFEDLRGLSDPQTDGQWYYCSDSQVIAVTENRVLSAEAYILFYERVL